LALAIRLPRRLAVASPAWARRQRRLDDSDDYARYEIRTALNRCMRVIPVLVDGTRAPRQQQLPNDLHKLARLNALDMSYARLDYDATRLVDAIQRVLGATAGNQEE
jgi:hypothetical protein